MEDNLFGITNLFNQEAEQLLLGKILVDNTEYFKLRSFSPEYFYHEVHGRIFKAAEKLILESKTASPVSLKPLFTSDPELEKVGGAKYLAEISNGSWGMMTIWDLGDGIRDLFHKRLMREKMMEWMQDLCTPKELKTAQELASELYGTIGEVASLGKKHTFDSFLKVAHQVIEDMENPLEAFSTGIRCLDESLGGGIYPRRSYCFAAPPKSGKTVMMATISMNMALANIPHVYIACEMGKKEIMQRNMARMAGMNSMAFVTKRKDATFAERIVKFTHNANKNCFFVDAPYVKFEELKRIVMTGIKRHGVKGIFLDYMQLVTGKRAKDSLVEHHEEVSNWLAEIARNEDIFVIYAAQRKKDGTVRGGSAIEQAVDQLYSIELNKKDKTAWMQVEASRYMPEMEVGTKESPSLRMHKNGPHFKDAADKVDDFSENVGLTL